MQNDDSARIRKIATERGLASYMNDTKWRELCAGFQNWPQPPRYRVQDLLAVDHYVSDWDREWYYHPRPYVSIRWLEVELAPEQIAAAVALCKEVGAQTEATAAGIRIWGWAASADRPPSKYRAAQEQIMARLDPNAASARLTGTEASQFLLVEQRGRGVEFYGGAADSFVIDPAIGDELQGERTYPSFDLAVDAAARWLNGCALEEL